MSLLEVTNLTHCFTDKTLYKNASFSLYNGEHMGVVGKNGAGKSTLINIMMEEIIPDEGNIKWQPNIRIGHLDQYAQIAKNMNIIEYLKTAYKDLYLMETLMNELYIESAASCCTDKLRKAANYQEVLASKDFYSVDSNISKVAQGLGITAIGTERLVSELSGGQRAKVILAKLLLEKPEILLLDEPTNFLDKEHIDWLSEYLKSYKGAFIVVSHDYDFIKEISTCICDIEFGSIKKYFGSYSDFLRQKKHMQEDYVRQYNAQQKKIEQTEEFIRRNIAGVNTKMAQGRRKHLERMERIAPPQFSQKPAISFRQLPLPAQTVLTVNNLEVGYDCPILPQLNFSVTGGQKMVITGFNGIGKSTLLKTLVGKIPNISGDFRFSDQVRIAYYEQDLQWKNSTVTPVQIVSEHYPKLTLKEIFKQLAKCGVKDTNFSQSISTLSGGEQSKVKMCLIMLSPCNFLILDEPTNHFDADAKESLQKALNDFKGSVVLVSHEESFYSSLADKFLNIEDCFE